MENQNTGNTQIYKSPNNGWTGETQITINDTDYQISTYKGRNGTIVSNAQKGTITELGFSYMLFQDKNTNLVTEKARVTENAIRAQHAKALLLFDATIGKELKEQPTPYEIKVGQKIISHGYAMELENSNYVVYSIVAKNVFNCVDTNTLELKRIEQLRDINEVFGIGYYYKQGDFYHDLDELNNIVIKAKELEAKRQNEEESHVLLQKMATAGKIEQGKKTVTIPNTAVSVIVAELMQDESDSQSDYFHSSCIKKVYLAFSTSKRDSFAEMRKACLNTDIEEIRSFATVPTVDRIDEPKTEQNAENWKPRDEHRNKYAMGDGYYLGEPYSRSGWRISKENHTDLHKIQDIYIATTEDRYFCESQPQPQEITEAIIIGNLELVDYSDKAIALFGDTKAIKEELKALNGKYNRSLRYKDTKVGGWIFQKNKKQALEDLIKQFSK